MATVLLSIAFFGLAMAGMAMGVSLSNRALKGSCGGVGSKDCLCDIEKQRACKLKALAAKS